MIDVIAISSNRSKKIIGVVAFAAFTIGFIWAYKKYPLALEDLNWIYLAIVGLLLLPVVALSNALRFRFTAHALNHPCTLHNAFAVTVFSTAANMLPIPGGMIVRTANLKGANNNIRGALSATFLTSVLSAMITLLLAAAAYLGFKTSALSVGLFGGAVIGFFTAVVLVAHSELNEMLGKLICVEIAATLLDAIRLMACFAVIGVSISHEQAITLTSASVVGSAVGIVPAGLGVKEITSAAIALHLSLVPSATYVAVGLNRIIGASFFAVLTLTISFYRGWDSEKLG